MLSSETTIGKRRALIYLVRYNHSDNFDGLDWERSDEWVRYICSTKAFLRDRSV